MHIGIDPPAYWDLKYRNDEGIIIAKSQRDEYVLLNNSIHPLFIFSRDEAQEIAKKTEKGKKVLVNLLSRYNYHGNILIIDLMNIIYHANQEGKLN